MTFLENEAIIIPAFKPTSDMIALIEKLQGFSAKHIIIVDDGSGSEFAPVFAKAAEMGCVMVPHGVNQGKGRALKTAFNHIIANMPQVECAVTADADGQHTAEDILQCAKALRGNYDSLVLGCRDFDQKDVPKRSVLGNKITRSAMKSLCSVAVTDTQTGLRALGRSFMSRLITVAGERYEFETNMLLETNRAEVKIIEVPIKTVYINNNEGSHFNPIRDSIKIYALLLKFVAASLASSVVDISMFAIITSFIKPFTNMYIPIATVGARIVSAIFNYFINKNVVFQSGKSTVSSGIKYLILCIVQMTASALLVMGIYSLLPLPETLIKVVVDIILFFISFQIQKTFIFGGTKCR